MQKQVTIIGSGIVGAVTAYYLSADPTLNVTIYDEGIGQATKNSAGIISFHPPPDTRGHPSHRVDR